MQVVHIAGVPPNQGRKYLPVTSWRENNRNAPRQMVIQYGYGDARVAVRGSTSGMTCSLFISLLQWAVGILNLSGHAVNAPM